MGLHRGHLKMSEEGDVVMVEETPVTQETPVEEPMDIESALKEVLKRALVANGLGRGLRECQQALEKGKVHLCLLAADCNEPAYVSLITALCLENNVKLLKVKKAKSLGEWLVFASSIAITTPARSCLLPVLSSPPMVRRPRLSNSSSTTLRPTLRLK